MENFRKPRFLEQDDAPKKDSFERILDSELQSAKAQDPNVSFETVLAAVAKKHPEQYELHARKIGGDQYASIDTVENPYFKKVSDLYFSELRKQYPNADYSDAVAECSGLYPKLYESHLAGRLGVSIPQSRVTLSERKNATAVTGKQPTLDRFRFAKRAFTALVQNHLDELKKANAAARYEQALSESAARFSELYCDYQIAVGS